MSFSSGPGLEGRYEVVECFVNEGALIVASLEFLVDVVLDDVRVVMH